MWQCKYGTNILTTGPQQSLEVHCLQPPFETVLGLDGRDDMIPPGKQNPNMMTMAALSIFQVW